ncbi:hypothetical protein TCAL_14552 [Tigriopus californicus]|uniref:Uncharacterized protein n=1 Tax=Tigriopus californicus TaxID=6832 RepID=A0A553PCS4_TIGCA|nr:hypothetical protein TCAL_14552 [Tigriopus californicus]
MNEVEDGPRGIRRFSRSISKRVDQQCGCCSFQCLTLAIMVVELLALSGFIGFNIFSLSVTVKTRSHMDFCIIQIVLSAIFFLTCLLVIGGIQAFNEYLFLPYISISILGLLAFFILAPIHGFGSPNKISQWDLGVQYSAFALVSAAQIFNLWIVCSLYAKYKKALRPQQNLVDEFGSY